ncbi:MAG: ABC transporter permease [Vicinamibacterales bacterium]
MSFYRALLHLYPKSFRGEYGAEMCAVFARELESARGIARAMLLARALVDTLVNAARVHADITRQDLRYAVRSLRRTPGFTVTAVAVAALGIGATTAAFSVADHVLLRPLPFPDSQRLVKLWQTQVSRGYSRLEPSPPNYLDWKRLATSFEGVEAYTATAATLLGNGAPERIAGQRVTGGMFALLGRSAATGRTLVESDIDAGQNPIVISDRLWRTRFAADPNILGQTLSLDDATSVIVGVMPPDFIFPDRATDFWRPFRLNPESGDEDRNNHYLGVVARLKPDVTFEQSRSEMRVIAEQLRQQYPKELSETSASAFRWRDEVRAQSRMLLAALVAASLCLLLIACTNLANLLMSRALARRAEFAVRAAVGASVDRLVRQMLTDSLLLAGAGGVLGVVLATVSAPLVVRMVPSALPIAEVPPLDLRLLLGAAIVTVITGVAFGVLPALRVCRKADGAALKESGRGGTGRATERLRSALVVAEIVASVVLLVSAGLLIQALVRVQAIDPGFKMANVLTLRTSLPTPKYELTATRSQFYDRVLGEVQALPGVARAAYISFLPMTMRGGIWPILTTTEDPESPGGFVAPDALDQRVASVRFVTPGFFDAIGTPLLQGRDVGAGDTLDTRRVAVVSQSFARDHFPGQDPIGRQFAVAFAVRTIVGVVGDIRVRGLERESEPQVYMPAAQQFNGQLSFYKPQDLVVRSTVPSSTLIAAVRSIINRADPQQPITDIKTLEEVVGLDTAPRVVQLRVLGAFAAAAFLLAAIGIHGLLAFTVSARTREIGVRIALGAKPADILRIVVGRSAGLSVIGVVIGAVLAYAAARAMQSLLAGVEPGNAAVFASAVALALLMTLAGSILPAWRAVRVDPLTATRAD